MVALYWIQVVMLAALFHSMLYRSNSATSSRDIFEVWALALLWPLFPLLIAYAMVSILVGAIVFTVAREAWRGRR